MALLIAALTLQVVNYSIVVDFKNLPEWSTMIEEKCGADILVGAFQTRSLFDFADVIAFIWGAYYGLLA